MIKAADTLAS